MNIRKLSIILPLVLVIFAGATSFAQADLRLRGKITTRTLNLNYSDPAISTITANACKCDLSDVNALYMKGVKAKIFNHGQINAIVNLKLSWHDLISGTIKTVTRSNVSIPGRRHTTVQIISTAILAKRSVGVTVEIIPVSPADRDLSNNKKTVRYCATYIVE